MSAFMSFWVGCLVGCVLGTFALSLMVVARDAEERANRMQQRRDHDDE